MSFKKNLEPEDVSITPFYVHKTFTFSNTDSGSGFYSVSLVKGTDSNLYNFSNANAASSSFGTGSVDSPKTRTFFHVPLWQSINKLYYKDISDMKGYIDYINGVPSAADAIVNYTSEDVLENTKLSLRRPYTRQLHDTATLINIPQKYFGQIIQPKSVRITDDSTASTIILEDDGYGNLYDVAYSSSYSNRTPDTTNSGSVVGNIFYNDGVAVITDTGSYSTVGTGKGTDGFTIKFNSTEKIYEREYVCRVDENEFIGTTSKTLKVGQSGSVSMATNAFSASVFAKTNFDGFPYDLLGYATSSYESSYNIGTELIGVATHSDFNTYVSTIGLYNDEEELLAVGKLAKPVKNEKELALSFVVRFDTN